MTGSCPALIAVVGPTAVGKTRLSLELAEAFGGEIVNADSRQVYRGMDIGTSKATAEERRRVAHHLLDVRDPDEEFNLAHFLELADKAIADVHGRGRLPILVGGSGQYVWALLEGWQVPAVPPDSALRADLELQAERRGAWALYQLLSAVAPDAARNVDPKNARRIIRALEIHFSLGKKADAGRVKKPREERLLVLGLTMERGELYRRIDERVEQMLRDGFVDEVKGLQEKGYGGELPSMSGVGYQELALHLRGEMELGEAAQQTKYRTHRIARHQYAWFRREDARIRWLESDGSEPEKAAGLVRELLGRCDRIGPVEMV